MASYVIIASYIAYKFFFTSIAELYKRDQHHKH